MLLPERVGDAKLVEGSPGIGPDGEREAAGAQTI